MTTNQRLSGTGISTLAEALQKNTEAAAAVEDVADQLGIVHAVLSNKIAESDADPDVKGAVKRTRQLEAKLSETTDKMDEVNQALEASHAALTHLSKAG
ncbi:MAG: hypothetical protein JWQ73_872 [Variovorax sp.]|nr:hypothetical protein [Variovorax sp.]